MPTYEYKCLDCGYEFEEFQSIKAEPISICPKCGGKVKKLISMGGGLLFKGSGFYITDYRTKEYKDAARRDHDSGATSAVKNSGSGKEKKSTNSKSKEAA